MILNEINYVNIKATCDILTLALVDDSLENARPLIHLSVEGL
jgi:hypothetical protein